MSEPADGLPRIDRAGVLWTPRAGFWWGDLGGTGEQQPRTWGEIESREPVEVAQ